MPFAVVTMSSITDQILGLPAWLILGLVFLLPALEASAFLGFVFPGETAAILGGVVASQSRIPLWAVIVAVVSGAIVGDSVGYWIGRRWGTHLLHGTVGRLPIIRRQLDKNLTTAEAYVRRRKGSAVFFGRFTAALRVLVPGLAGMSGVHYPSFAAYNVAGGVVWGSAFVILGYVAGASYKQVEKIAGRIGLALLGLIVVGLITSWLVRRLSERSSSVNAVGEALAASPPVAWVRRRFPAQLSWTLNRLDPTSTRGFWLTFSLAVAALAVWAFAGLTQDVMGHDEMALVNPQFEAWVVPHRIGWVSSAMPVVTWLGSGVVIVSLTLVAVIAWVVRRRDWGSAMLLIVAVAGAASSYAIVKPIVGEARPPAGIWIGHFDGAAFPSGHATQAVAFYGMLALVLSTKRSLRTRVLLWSGAGLVALAVGVSRLYLGAHWLTDVLAGYALGVAWIAVVMAASLVLVAPGGRWQLFMAVPDRSKPYNADRPALTTVTPRFQRKLGRYLLHPDRSHLSRRLINALSTAAIKRGIGPSRFYLLSVVGRKSGIVHSTPVSLVFDGSTRFLVGPYGEVGWVRNARAAGVITLARGGYRERFSLVPVHGTEAGSILKRYLKLEPGTRHYFDVSADAPVAAFEGEVAKHPVFRLTSATS